MKLTRIVCITVAIAIITAGAAQAQFGRGGGGFGGGGGGFGGGGFGGGGAQFGQPAAGFGQSPGGALPNAKPAWTQFKLNPNIRVTLDFRNANVDAVVHYFSQQSGIAIIKDPSLTGGITLESPKPQSLNDAFTMLNVVLGLHNPAFGIVKQGNFLLLSPKAPAFSPQAFSGFGNRPGGGSQTQLQVYVLHYASATTLATVINQVFAQTTAGAVTGPGGGGGGFGGGPGGAFARFASQFASGPNNGPVVHASADDYSNSLIVNAPDMQQGQIAGIISQIDIPTDQPQTAKVFPLQYALASDLQPEVQSILTGSTPLGRAGAASTAARQNNQGGGGFGFFARFNQNSNSTANGTVSADTRTNSLIVTSTQVNIDEVGQVIAQLDKPAVYESTTFVYTMKNARADVVANLLNESFGNRTTNGPVGGSLTNPTFTTSNLGTASSSTTPGGGAGTGTGTNGARTGGTNNSNFNVTTSNGSQNQTGDTTGLDEDGHIVNIRNLTGQVLLVPNIDTNSIIVVCPPEDKSIVTNVLDQMDEIPAQVMIQTMVVEASLDKTDSLGVEYSTTLGNPFGHGTFNATQNYGTVSTGTATSTQNSALGLPAGGQFTLSAGGYSATLSAIEQNSKFNVLSRPNIFTTNNATAQINISQSIPYLTNSTVDTETGAETNTYDFLDVGIILTVTPRITSNGYVTMDVSQTANDLVSLTPAGEPIVNQRETQTTVSVKDGYTVVLGGIIENQLTDTVNKVPLLGDIPLLGQLFRSTSKQNNKTELLVFLTPHVIVNPQQGDALRVATEKELDKSTQEMLPSMSGPDTPAVTPSDPPAAQ